jgi:transcription elongation factor GreA-like protein
MQNLAQLQQAEVVFWREQYKKRFPQEGTERTLRAVYDDIQREIDHERNEVDSIYRRMAGNRPDPALYQAQMRKVEEKRAGLVAAFNEVLDGATKRGVRLSPRGALQAFHINTGWFFHRLYWSVFWPFVWPGGISYLLIDTPLRVVGLALRFIGKMNANSC